MGMRAPLGGGGMSGGGGMGMGGGAGSGGVGGFGGGRGPGSMAMKGHGPVVRNEGHAAIIPISSLNPYSGRWSIKVCERACACVYVRCA